MSVSRTQAELRVLVVAPTGGDAANVSAMLGRAGLGAAICPNLSAVALEIADGCGVILLTEEAVNYERYRDLSRALAAEPKWSAIPVVLLVGGGKTPSFHEEAARAIGARGNLLIVERPVRTATLLSTLRSALAHRAQQYEVRDLLREREELLGSLERKVEERTRKLQEANAELEAFSYSVSHDLRAPLRSMESYARILCEEHAENLNEEGRYYAQRIMKNAAKMDRLMVDVLTMSRVSRSELDLAPVDVAALVEEVIDQYPDLAAVHKQIHVAGPLGRVIGDHSSLVQCFSNLLQNAFKFVPPDRTAEVRVTAIEEPAWVTVSVADNGIGIDPAVHERIFGMFERAGPANVPGTGIGLAIVKKAVDRMGGAVGVESAPDQGARFWLRLPRAGE